MLLVALCLQHLYIVNAIHLMIFMAILQDTLDTYQHMFFLTKGFFIR